VVASGLRFNRDGVSRRKMVECDGGTERASRDLRFSLNLGRLGGLEPPRTWSSGCLRGVQRRRGTAMALLWHRNGTGRPALAPVPLGSLHR